MSLFIHLTDTNGEPIGVDINRIITYSKSGDNTAILYAFVDGERPHQKLYVKESMATIMELINTTSKGRKGK
ncbi:MAG: hypothetical protein V4615_04680 [Bacteroidota bacterium]